MRRGCKGEVPKDLGEPRAEFGNLAYPPSLKGPQGSHVSNIAPATVFSMAMIL